MTPAEALYAHANASRRHAREMRPKSERDKGIAEGLRQAANRAVDMAKGLR